MTRVVVLGGGPAGDVAALRGVLRGAEVTLIERAELGGTCLNWGCIPTKSLLAGADLLRRVRRAAEFGIDVGDVRVDFTKMMARKDDVVLTMRRGVAAACERKQVRVVRGQGVVEGNAVVVNGERHEFDRLIVCVGTEPAGLPGVDMDNPRVVTSNGILTLERVPRRLLVIGGGVVGCEFASLFAPLGSAVTIVEMLPQILAGVDSRVVSQFRNLMAKDGVTFHTGRKIVTIEDTAGPDGGGQVTAQLDDDTYIEADLVLVSVGRRPQTGGISLDNIGVTIDGRGFIQTDDYLQTTNPAVYAAGDCIGGLQLAHLASAEGARAVENALGYQVRPIDRTVVPACIYTHPEIAMVGLTAEAAKVAGYAVKIGQARLAGSGKALAEGEPQGSVQIVADAAAGIILGATIMGAHAVEVIHEIAVAMSDGLTLDELGDIIHAHPTVSEMVMDAAEQGEGVAPYL